MKTKAVPAVIMLTAGLIDSIFSIYCHLSLWRFTWQLLVVLIVFYVLGCVVQLILDKNFAGMGEIKEEQKEGQEEETEDSTEEGESLEESGQAAAGEDNK